MKKISLLFLIGIFTSLNLQPTETPTERNKEKTIKIINNSIYKNRAAIYGVSHEKVIIPERIDTYLTAKEEFTQKINLPTIEGFSLEFAQNKRIFAVAIGKTFRLIDPDKKAQIETLEKINFSSSNNITITINGAKERELNILVETDKGSASFSDLKHFLIFIS